MTQTPHNKIDHYDVEAILGKGGMGVVYLAYDKRLDRKVAIKCIRRNRANSLWVAAVQEEAKLLAQINHTNIVQIYDLIEWQGAPALVMEYVEGKTLLDWLCSDALTNNQLSLDTRLDWLNQIARGLACAHEKGIIHRDLKPENIMIGADGQVKIMDFGIARHQAQPQAANIHDSQALPGEYIGSPASLSPEQAMGDDLTTASDIFSFGILAYSLLCGHHPFGDAEDPDGILHGILYRAPIPFKIDDTRNWESVERYVLSALNKEAAGRPSAQELTHKLNPPPVSPEPSSPEPNIAPAPQQAAKKSPLVLAALVIVAIAIVALVYYTTPPKPTRFFAVLPPIQEFKGLHDTETAETILTSIDNTIQEALLSQHNIRLIDRAEWRDLGNTETAAVGLNTGATDIVRPSISCQSNRCSITLELLQGPNWVIKNKHTWPVYLESPNDIYYTTWQSSLALIGNSKLAPERLEESDYLDYLTLLEKFNTHAQISGKEFESLSNLAKTYPNFSPAYRLITKAAIGHFNAANDSKQLAQVRNLLMFQASKIQPKLYHELQSLLLLTLDQFEDAKIEIEKLRTLGELDAFYELNARLALENNNFEQAEILYRKLILTRPSISHFYALAYTLYAQGKLNDALTPLKKIIALSPNNKPANSFLAGIAMTKGEFDLAIESYTRLLEETPHPSDFANIATAHLLNHEYEKALEYQSKAIDLTPKSPGRLTTLGEIYLSLNLRDEAEAAFTRSLMYSKETHDISDIIVRATAKVHLGYLTEAKTDIEQAKSIESDNAEVQYLETLYYASTGNIHDSMKMLNASLEKGYNIHWFSLPWFASLCSSSDYSEKLKHAGLSEPCNAEVPTLNLAE